MAVRQRVVPVVVRRSGVGLLQFLEERHQVAGMAVEILKDMRVIVHVGAASLFEVTQLIDGARRAGATEVAVLTPYYLPTTSDEVFAFYEAVASHARGLDVYVYMFEARTGIAVDEELITRLAALPGVVGVKMSGEPLDRIAAFRSCLPDDFLIYTGADGDFAKAGQAGASGVISGVASALARPFTAMRDALLADDVQAVERLQPDISEAVAAMEGSPSRMRAVHRLAGSPVGGRRMPIPEPAGEVLQRLARLVEQFH